MERPTPAISEPISERIRRPTPLSLSVLPGSLPVVSFGDPDVASVATLALNPSWREFQSQSGDWLLKGDRRLASLVSLDAAHPSELDDDQLRQVLADSYGYFHGPNWYRGWFHWLESLLQGVGLGSYHDGSACHLDLVQWATKPAQGSLSTSVWTQLVDGDRDFLAWQLGNTNVTTVLLNGASVVRWMKHAGFVETFDEGTLTSDSQTGRNAMRVFRAVSGGILFIGWNRPLASAIASTSRERLKHWVRNVVKEHQVVREKPAGWADGHELDEGYVRSGTTVSGPDELEQLLLIWLESSGCPTVGDVDRFGGSPVISVEMHEDVFVLNRDSKRAAVREFLAAAAHAGGASQLPWHVTANRRGVVNRVSYRPDDGATPGWYAYLKRSASEPRGLR